MHMDPVSNLIQEISIDPAGDQIAGGIIGFGESEAGELYIVVTEWNFNPTGRVIAIVDGVAPGLDRDNDGVDDDVDNCLEIPNGPNDTATTGPSQNDTDGDSFGNICDPDFNGNGIVDPSDFSLLKSRFGQPGFPDQDLNGNGIVDPFDFSLLKTMFGRPPGPSGVTP